jgi:hypothetical protein
VESVVGELSAGEHTMKVTLDSPGVNNSDVGNLNFFDFVPDAAIPDGGLPEWDAGSDAGAQDESVRVETEDFLTGPNGYYDTTAQNLGGAGVLTEAVDVGFSGDAETPGSLAIGYTQPGEWLRYLLVLPRTADYTLRARVAHDAGGGTFSVYLDEQRVGSFTVPSTGGWGTWLTIEAPLGTLEGGAHLLKLTVDTLGVNNSDAGNVNYLEFVPSPVIDEGDGGLPADAGAPPSDAGAAVDAGASSDAGGSAADAAP